MGKIPASIIPHPAAALKERGGRGDDRRRLEAAYREHLDALRAFLRRSLSSEEDVADIAQEVFVRLLRIGSLDCLEPNPRAYIFQIGKNLIRDRYRRESKGDTAVASVDPTVNADECGPAQAAIWQQRLEYLEQCIGALPETLRRAFLLHRLHGRGHGEIAALMGISRRSVRRHIAQALTVLHSQMERIDEFRE